MMQSSLTTPYENEGNANLQPLPNTIDGYIAAIKMLAPKARAFTAIDLEGRIPELFTVLENLSSNTPVAEFRNVANTFLKNGLGDRPLGDNPNNYRFQHSSSWMVPKLG